MGWSNWLVLLLCICSISARRGFPVSFLSVKASDHSHFPATHRIPVGLKNLANTCYMNSVIQSVFHSSLLDRLIDCNVIPGSTGWHLKNLFDKMFKKEQSRDTKLLARNMGVNINIQEDAEEFLLKLLDKLGSSVDKGTLVTDMFEFDILQTIDCTRVSYSSSRKQKYTDLSLDIIGSKTDIPKCLSNFFAPELLKGDALYKTSSHGYQEAIKSLGLSSTPEELIIHLKRFSYDAETNNYAKVLTPVDVPLSLNLTRFIHVEASDDVKNNAVYDLSSVVIHDGDSLDYGHYVTLVRRPASALSPSDVSTARGVIDGSGSSVWYKIDDHIVTKIGEEEALTLARGSSSGSVESATTTKGSSKPSVECHGGVCRRVDRPSVACSVGRSASAYLVFYTKRHKN